MSTNSITVTVLAVFALGCGAGEQTPAAEPAATPEAPTDPVQAKIDQAMRAAPAALAAGATIMDWPGEDGQMKELRAGSNGWMCMPSSPTPAGAPQEGENAMCLDQAWQGWAAAWTSKGPVPKFDGIGVAYMLLGDRGASNVDPYAAGPTADNQWVLEGPHVMLIAADPAIWNSLPTDPENGGPYVMWKGTPYVHVMVPLK